MAENQTMSSWDRIRQGVADVENLMDQKQYNLSMVRGRQTLEYMINYLAQSVRLQAPDMSTAVDELYNLKVINAQSRENYHNIRSLGNRAAHEGNNSSADAAASYQMLSREVYAFADSYAKTARQIGQMIRNGQSVPTRGETSAQAQNYGGSRYQGQAAQADNGQSVQRTSNDGTGSTTRIPRVGNGGNYESAGAARTASARNGYTLNTQPEISLTSTRRSAGSSGSGSYAGTGSSGSYGASRNGSSGASAYGTQRISAYGTGQRAGSQNAGYQGSNYQGTNAQGARRSASGAGGRNYGSSSARDYEASGSRTQSGRSGGSSARRPNRSSATIAGISPEIILKIMIPIILVILLIAVIKFVTGKSSTNETETSEVAVTESVAETMQVVTAAPIPVQTTAAQTEAETTQAAVTYKYTTTDSLKVRTAPGTDAGVIDVLQAGTEVVFIEQTDDKWTKISYNGTEAYVATEYLKKEQVQ